MEKVNPEAPNSLRQGIERCIQGCITLHKDIAMTDPYPEIAIKAAEDAKQVISAIVDPKTKVVATVPNVPVNVPAASKVNESTSTQTKSVTIFANTAKIDTMDTESFLMHGSYGHFNQITAWIDAANAVEDAAKEAQETWNGILSALQSVIGAMAKWMRMDDVIAARMTGKLSKLSLFVAVYRRRGTLYSAYMDEQRQCSYIKDFMMNYIKKHANADTVEELKKLLDDTTKYWIDKLIDTWTKDMQGIWGTADKMIQSGSTVVDRTWMEVKDQLMKAIRTIRDAKWKMITKRPYTEVCFASIYIIPESLKKVYPPVQEAKVAFEALEKEIEQIEKDVSTLAEALDGLSPFSESLSGSQTK
jgi:hypothetical protein